MFSSVYVVTVSVPFEAPVILGAFAVYVEALDAANMWAEGDYKYSTLRVTEWRGEDSTVVVELGE